MPRIPGALRALLENLIDYAGLYPPAALPLPEVLRNYRTYLASSESWMLNRLVLPAAKLPEVCLEPNWRVTLLVEAEPGSLPIQIETLETKLPRRLSLPTYCEAPVATIVGAFAKVRAGGLQPDAVPSSKSLADFLEQAHSHRMAFKATAGLHHPIRSLDPPMHGFVNLVVAAIFAWQRAPRDTLIEILDDPDPASFQFSDAQLRWRTRAATTSQIQSARRNFAHSFGSCSFEEPLADLRALGWLSSC